MSDRTKEEKERINKIKFVTQKLQEQSIFEAKVQLDDDLTQATNKRLSMGNEEAVALRERIMQHLERTGMEMQSKGQCEKWLEGCDPWIAKVR